jgi:hypothetical protein
VVCNTCVYSVGQWASFCGWSGIADSKGLRNHLHIAYCLPPPGFRKSGMYEENPKIIGGKTMSGDPTIWSITTRSITED